MTEQPAPTRSHEAPPRLIALGAVAGVAAGLAAVYGIGATQRNPA